MEKRGVIDPRLTKPESGEEENTKTAGDVKQVVESLDNDLTKRAADKVTDTLK